MREDGYDARFPRLNDRGDDGEGDGDLGDVGDMVYVDWGLTDDEGWVYRRVLFFMSDCVVVSDADDCERGRDGDGSRSFWYKDVLFDLEEFSEDGLESRGSLGSTMSRAEILLNLLD